MTEGLAIAKAIGSREDEASALVDLAMHQARAGDPGATRDLLSEAAELQHGTTDVQAVLFLAIGRTGTLLRAGELEEVCALGATELDRRAVWAEPPASNPPCSPPTSLRLTWNLGGSRRRQH